MNIDRPDFAALREGRPPDDPALLCAMSAGPDPWFDHVREHYLENFIASGGSKVKIVVGDEGTGKTHAMRRVAHAAAELGYAVVSLSLRDDVLHLNDMPGFYREVANGLDEEDLHSGICRKVGRELGYEAYDGRGPILPLLVEGGLSNEMARKELRDAAYRVASREDMSRSFVNFAYWAIRYRMSEPDEGRMRRCWRWLFGERLDPGERRESALYERLSRANARQWLYSLVRLIRLSGRSGLVVLIDDMEAVTEPDSATGRHYYTKARAMDTFEFLRQLIDDADLLEHFLLILGGRRSILEDEKRGFKSYEALWMRIQTGLDPGASRFNPFADLVDMDRFRAGLGPGFADTVGTRVGAILTDAGHPRKYREIEFPTGTSVLRKAVMEAALLADSGVES